MPVTKPTNITVMRDGDLIEDRPCEEAADAVEHIMEYEGVVYSVVCDVNGNPKAPHRPANPTARPS